MYLLNVGGVVQATKIPLLYKVRSLGKNDRRSDVTEFGCKMVASLWSFQGAYDTFSLSRLVQFGNFISQ